MSAPARADRPSLADRVPPGSFAAAVLDWGIGGTAMLGLLSGLLRSRGIRAPLLYISDSGFVPYGRAPAGGLRSRLASIRKALREAGVPRLLVACNAMSTAIPPGGSSRRGPIARGMLSGGLEGAMAAARGAAARRVIVLGGEATIRSGLWARPLRRAGFDVAQRVAQPLSAIVESGGAEGEEFLREARRACPPSRPGDLLLLACTHYPAGRKAFERLMPDALVYDPAPATAAAFARLFEGRAPRTAHARAARAQAARLDGERILALTTGDPEASSTAARLAFGSELDFLPIASFAPVRRRPYEP